MVTKSATVQQLDELGKTQKGTLQRGVKTLEHGWIKIRGNVSGLQIGDKLTITEPSEFGKAKYSELVSVAPRATVTSKNGNSPKPRDDGVLTVEACISVMEQLHRAAAKLEPNDATARCALVVAGLGVLEKSKRGNS